MSKNNITSIKEADSLYINIKELVNQSKNNIYRVVNTEMLFLYWNIGKMIVEKQGGNERAKYGDYIISSLSTKLVLEFGNGYSIQNLKRMRKFYLCFPISSTVSSQLCWSHYTELIKIDNENERNYYMYECIRERWSVRELQNRIKTHCFERDPIRLEKSNSIDIKYEPKNIIKEPTVLEFLNIENNNYSEGELENSIMEHLKEFMLELGRGFSFKGRHVRITINNEHYYPDLVFYNTKLKCYVIIDLKVKKTKHKDIGQMSMYVNYYDREIKEDDDNNTVGILLSIDKNKTLVDYTLNNNSNITSREYKLNIPSKEELIAIVEEEKNLLW